MNKSQNNLIFDDIITKKSYSIPDKIAKSWTLYKNRFALAGAMGVLLWSFKIEYPFAIALSAAFVIVSEIMFRFKFLPKCTEIKNVSIKNKVLSNNIKIFNIVLWSLTSIGLFILLKDSKQIDLSGAIYLIGVVVSASTALLYLVSLFYKKK